MHVHIYTLGVMKDSCVGETVPIEVVLHVLLPYLAITAYSTRESLLVEVRLAPRTSAVVWSPVWNRCTGGQLLGSVARMPEAHPPVEKHSTPRLIAVLKEWI